MKRYQTILLFVFLFVFFFIWNVFIVDLYADEVWNYGFCYAIYKGFLPYRDFNMVVTPLYPFLMAFFFSIFGFNMIVYHIVNTLIITGLCYLVYKLVGNKMWLVLLFLAFPMSIMFPSYNLLVLFFFVLLLYLEKEKKNDWIIGLVIGLAILTKQSIGVCLFLPTLYYWKDKKKILKRIGGMMIPCFIFLIYLLCSHTFMSFLDLCLFGLFDFTKNRTSFNFIYILVFVSILFFIWWIRKDSKNISIYYALAMISMVIPMFEKFHFQFYFFAILLVFLMWKDTKIPVRLPLLFFGIMIGLAFVQSYLKFQEGFIYPNSLNHFEYRFVSKPMLTHYEEMNAFLDQYPDQEFVYLTNNAYLIRIERDENISFVDLINEGNHGYHGNDKLMKLIQSKKDALFVVNEKELDSKTQTNKNIIHYVLEHGEKIGEVRGYDVYQLKEE